MGNYTPPQALLGMLNKFIAEQNFSAGITGTSGTMSDDFTWSGGTLTTAGGSIAGWAQITVPTSGYGLDLWNSADGSYAQLVVGNFTAAAGTFNKTVSIVGIQYGATPASSSPTIVSGTIYQNTTGRYVFLYIPVTYSPTSTAAATAAFALGASSTPATIFTNSEPATSIAGRIDTLTLSIPPGWYYSLTVTNATIGTTTEVQQ